MPVSFRADPRERAAVRAEAQRRGISQSDLIRAALIREGVRMRPSNAPEHSDA